MKKIPILVILGPTATGKSDLAVKLAHMIARKHIADYKGAEVISADSRQVYRGMDIGTGKITKREMQGIKHHLLDVADPRKRFTVVEFQDLADRAIMDITLRGKLPIICGGTGFYIDAVVNTISFPGVIADGELRAKLRSRSVAQLYSMLKKLNPTRALSMNYSDSQNPVRLIRAIEIARYANNSDLENIKVEGPATQSQPVTNTGRMVTHKSLHHNYGPIFIGLKESPEILRQRINNRLLKRLKSGMLEEARRLHIPKSKGGSGLSWKRMEELGLEYRYMARHLQGEISKEEMVAELEVEIWHYARRQMTWFRRDKRIRWFEAGQILHWVSVQLTVD